MTGAITRSHGTALFEQLQANLALPFRTEVLGVEVTVEALEVDAVECVTALCTTEGNRVRVPLQDLPLPDPPPRGADSVAAWCRWHDATR